MTDRQDHGADGEMTPCGRPHHPAPPQLHSDSPTSQPPDDEDAWAGAWLGQSRLLGLDLDRPELLDLRLDDCDVSGVVAAGFVARRVALRRTRVRGVTMVNGQLDDGLIEECVTDELSFRFSRLRQVAFRDCDLSGIDFTPTTFEHVTIERCDLSRARFDAATVKCLEITDCTLAGIHGVGGLKGAQVDAGDVPAMAIALAVEAGLRIVDR
jgi:uncharacterized protein YjbI with pentapeptide repeats